MGGSDSTRKFIKDVFVNVLANLIAAAVIYVIGALAGVFPRSPYLIAAAICIGLSYAGMIGYATYASFSRFVKRRRPNRTVLAWCVILFGAGPPFIPFLHIGFDSLIDKICYPGMGIGMVTLGVTALLQQRLDRANIDKETEGDT